MKKEEKRRKRKKKKKKKKRKRKRKRKRNVSKSEQREKRVSERREKQDEWQLTAIPTGSFRPPYSAPGLGSRREHRPNTKRRTAERTGSHKISRGTRHRVDVVCGPSHPGRALNELGWREGRWRRPSSHAS